MSDQESQEKKAAEEAELAEATQAIEDILNTSIDDLAAECCQTPAWLAQSVVYYHTVKGYDFAKAVKHAVRVAHDRRDGKKPPRSPSQHQIDKKKLKPGEKKETTSEKTAWNDLEDQSRDLGFDPTNLYDWVFENLQTRPGDIDPTTVPCAGAVGFLRWARTEPGRKELYSELSKRLAKLKNAAEDQESRFTDDGRKCFELLDRYEGWLKSESIAVLPAGSQGPGGEHEGASMVA